MKFKPKKSLGQNFLRDKNILKFILDTAKITPKDHIVEVGPGHGILTNELANLAKKVTAIELDSNLIPILKDSLSQHKNITLINKDALKTPPPNTPYKVVANIPYYITSPLISHFLQAPNPPKSMTLLVQKEVAEKIIQLQPKMTILSLQTALFANTKFIKKVSKHCFYPVPKVDSAIIHLTPLTHPVKDAQKILQTAKRAFSQKRKQLKNTLPDLKFPPQIPPTARPETLSIPDWQALIKALK
ncbi:MAG: 16S rRNA (adenine(1518)-N(6)/adenine(1519)-N(6))-dimethyltransferase RsmA [Candidatus Peregrinibacteria bacterium]